MTTRGEVLQRKLESRGMEQFAEGEVVHFVPAGRKWVEKSAEPETQEHLWGRIRNAAAAAELTVDAYLDTPQGEALFGTYAAMQSVEKSEFPHGKAAGDAAKAAAGTTKRLQPGEGRKMASDVIAADVARIRKEHPNWSEAETWSWALENDSHAIETYNRGEIAERESRRK